MKTLVVPWTVIKHCSGQSELSGNALFNITIKEITGEEAKEKGLGLSAGDEGTKGSAPKDSL